MSHRISLSRQTVVGAVLLFVLVFVAGWFLGRAQRTEVAGTSSSTPLASTSQLASESPTREPTPTVTPQALNYGDRFEATLQAGDGAAQLSIALLGTQGWQDQGTQPERGRFVSIEAEIRNAGPATYSVGPSNFRLRDEVTDVEYTASTVRRRPRLEGLELKSTEQTSGWIVFDIPRGSRWQLVFQESRENVSVATWQLEL